MERAHIVYLDCNIDFDIGLGAFEIQISHPRKVELFYDDTCGLLTIRGKDHGAVTINWRNNDPEWPHFTNLCDEYSLGVTVNEMLPEGIVQGEALCNVKGMSEERCNENDFWLKAFQILDSHTGSSLKEGFEKAQKDENYRIDWSTINGLFPEDWKKSRSYKHAIRRLQTMFEDLIASKRIDPDELRGLLFKATAVHTYRKKVVDRKKEKADKMHVFVLREWEKLDSFLYDLYKSLGGQPFWWYG